MGRRLCASTEYPEPLLTVAGYQLPGAGRRFPDRPMDDAGWEALLAGARHHRVTGLLNRATGDGALPATPEQLRQAREVHRGIQMRVLALEQQLPSVVELLAERGIESRVLKGSAVAHLDYAEPGLRSFVDLDVLVKAADIDRAAAELIAAGFRRTLAEPRPGFDRRFDKGMTLIPPAGYELDLHRTFVLGPWGVIMKFDRLWDEGEQFEVGGRRMLALSRGNRFIHACYHAALGNWPLRLGSLRDVAEIQRRLDGHDVATLELVRAWGVEALVAAAVSDSRRLLGVAADDELSSWARDYQPSRREVAWLALHTHADKTFAAQAVATVRVLPSWRDRVAYLRALIFPNEQYTSDRHSSSMARFWYALREVRRGHSARR